MCTCVETSQLGLLACISLGTRGGEGRGGERGTLVEKEEWTGGMRGGEIWDGDSSGGGGMEGYEGGGRCGEEVYAEGEEEGRCMEGREWEGGLRDKNGFTFVWLIPTKPLLVEMFNTFDGLVCLYSTNVINSLPTKCFQSTCCMPQ